MPESDPNAQLLRSLGSLARGLSALFWGLPVALIICAETTRASWLKPSTAFMSGRLYLNPGSMTSACGARPCVSRWNAFS